MSKPIVEQFYLSEYERIEYEPSQLIPGKIVPVRTVFTCPRCACERNNAPRHGESARPCIQCGLWAWSMGNGLYVSDIESGYDQWFRDRHREMMS